jgi:hypothetical protein
MMENPCRLEPGVALVVRVCGSCGKYGMVGQDGEREANVVSEE